MNLKSNNTLYIKIIIYQQETHAILLNQTEERGLNAASSFNFLPKSKSKKLIHKLDDKIQLQQRVQRNQIYCIKNDDRVHANVVDEIKVQRIENRRDWNWSQNIERNYKCGRRHDGECVGEECKRILSLLTETKSFNLCQLFFHFVHCNI